MSCGLVAGTSRGKQDPTLSELCPWFWQGAVGGVPHGKGEVCLLPGCPEAGELP